ncbi:MAG: hypothetical protein AB1Z66_13060 [Candidatus Limnocylindrales bacterium]
MLIQPVLATVIAMVVLAESPSPPQLLGVALILGGVLLGSVRPRAGRPH